MKVEVTKCFLVQVMDREGNELSCEYIFCDTKEEARQRGRRMKEEIRKQIEER